MPLITKDPKRMGSRVVTEFVDSVGSTSVTFSIPDDVEQDTLTIYNISPVELLVSVGTQANISVPAYREVILNVPYTSFNIRSSFGVGGFRATCSYKDVDEEDEQVLNTKVKDLTTLMEGKANQSDVATLTTQLAQRATKTYVDTQIAGVGNGSPKGTYATLTALQTAFPTGTTGIYLVTADGKWYYWNGSAWTAGGTYQATGVADYGITNKHLALNALDAGSINPYLLGDFNGKLAYFPNAQSFENGMPVWLTYDINSVDITNLPIDCSFEFYTEDTNISQVKTKYFTGTSIDDLSGTLKNSTITPVLQKKIHNLSSTVTYTVDGNYLQVMIWVYAVNINNPATYYYNDVVLKINGTPYNAVKTRTYGVSNTSITDAKSLPTQLATPPQVDVKLNDSINKKTQAFNGYLVNAKTNTANTTKVQIDFVFDISGKGLVNGDAFTFACDITSDDSNIASIQTQYFLNTVGTAPSTAGTTAINPTAAVPYVVPKTSYQYSNTIGDATQKYLHCFLNVIVTDNTKTINFKVNNLALTLKGTTYSYSLNNPAFFTPNSSDTISFLQYLDSQIALVSYVNSKLLNYNINNLSGKVLNVLGDSMVYGHTLGFTKTWAYKLGQRNNMTVRNYGINGTNLGGAANGYGESMVNRYSSMDNTADYVAVFGGTNDQVNAIPLGIDTDNTNATFKGSLNLLCSGLISKYPSAKIFFITPYNRNTSIKAYVDAIKTICANYSIPVFDNWTNGGVCWSNTTQVAALTMNDTYHLNEAGMQYASTKYEAFMNAL